MGQLDALGGNEGGLKGGTSSSANPAIRGPPEPPQSCSLFPSSSVPVLQICCGTCVYCLCLECTPAQGTGGGAAPPPPFPGLQLQLPAAL